MDQIIVKTVALLPPANDAGGVLDTKNFVCKARIGLFL